jgi:hypothetical protein
MISQRKINSKNLFLHQKDQCKHFETWITSFILRKLERFLAVYSMCCAVRSRNWYMVKII